MVDTTKSRSALESVYTTGRFGVTNDTPGITIAERRGLTLLHVEHRDDDAESPLEIARAAGFPLPRAGHSSARDQRRILWLGPSRALITDRAAASGTLADAIRNNAPNAALNDVSYSRVVIRLSGHNTRDVLAAGCPLDLDASAFKPGMTATSNIDHFMAILDCVADDTFDVYVARGYGVSFWRWLIEASEEFGGEVLAAG